MKTFQLKSGDDILKKIKANDTQEAISIFSKIKKLSESDLIKLFTIIIE